MNERWSWALVVVVLLIAAAVFWHFYNSAKECEHHGGVYARRWGLMRTYDCLKER